MISLGMSQQATLTSRRKSSTPTAARMSDKNTRRNLNDILVDIDLVLIELKSFDMIDSRLGYHRLRVREEDILKQHLRLVTVTTSSSKKDHEGHLKSILELRKKEHLYAKFASCEFRMKLVQFLGHAIDSQCIHVNLAKIEAIKDWDAPTITTEKNKKFECGKEEDKAFQLPKQKLYSVL
nr:hypothetical protein [Tanacetum cinerariifolium]